MKVFVMAVARFSRKISWKFITKTTMRAITGVKICWYYAVIAMTRYTL